MSTKFFTWTKGDRRRVTDELRKEGIVPIPAEFISIKGVGNGRGRQERPALVLAEPSPELSPKQSSRTNDSIALHDAAVQSATNLMAVMNDMLRSPPMSSHLFAQTYPPRNAAMYGRPRSRTAPPTPVGEAPPTEYVELPGSSPFDRKASIDKFPERTTDFQPTLSDIQKTLGNDLSRPHSTPQNSTSKSMSLPPVSRSLLSPRPPCSRTSSDPHGPKAAPLSGPFGVTTQLGQADDQPARSYSSESILQPSEPLSLATSRSASANNIPCSNIQNSYSGLQPHGTRSDSGLGLLEEIATIRRSHEAHVEGVRAAHERELASYRSYISLLEKQQSVAQTRSVIELDESTRKANESEKALRNAIADLEARLVAANNERTDVLEGYHDACAKIREMCRRESEPTVDAEKAAKSVTRHKRAASDATRFIAASNPVWQQGQDLRRELASKEAQNRQLQHQISDQARGIRTMTSRVAQLQIELDKKEQMLDSARADSERYNSLLHHELRRQARAAVNEAHLATPRIEAEAFVVAAEKMLRLKAHHVDQSVKLEAPSRCHQDTASTTAALERELEHCIKEIIMYKLDAKTYRKELRKAQAKLEGTQSTSSPQPPILEARTPKSTPLGLSRLSPQVSRNDLEPHRGSANNTPEPAQPGLGISVFTQQKTSLQNTPTKDIASATSAALAAPSPTPAPSQTASPSSRPRTPLGIHKRLPRPPPNLDQRLLTPSPPQSTSKVQRNETHRSASDTIIPSYASGVAKG